MAKAKQEIIRRMRGVTVRLRGVRWWVFTNHNGKRKAKSFTTKEAADTFAKKVEKALKSATWNLGLLDWKLPGAVEPAVTVTTFAQYAQTYLDAKEPNAQGHGPLKYSTWRDYKGTVRRDLVPVLGAKDLTKITREDVRALPAALRKLNRRPHVIAKAKRVLSTVLTEAVEAKLIPVNPALGIRWKGELSTPKRPIMPLTADELRTVLTTARDHQVRRGGKTVHPYRRHYAFILLAAHTGLRLGEALALKLGDVDWNGRLLHVQRAWVRGKLTTPKSHKVRVVELTAAVFTALQAIRDERFPNTVAALDPEEHARLEAERARAMFEAWVFPNENGQPMDAHKWRRRVWYPLLLKAGVRHVRIHDLRHGFASLLLDQGESAHYVQAMLGHHSAAFTMSVYGHRMPRDHRGVDRLANVVPAVTEELQNDDHEGGQLATSDHETANNPLAAMA